MSIASSILKRFGFVHKSQVRSGFQAAALNRILNDWTLSTLSADSAIRKDLATLRARGRDLRDNNEWGRKYIRMVKDNVVGDQGMDCRIKVLTETGEADTKAGKLVGDHFWEWGKKQNCTVSRKLTWRDVQKMLIETTGTDGECLARCVRGFNNPFHFALEIIESDYLDIELNRARDDRGHTIRMGVELNRWKEHVAYWLLTDNPNDSYYWNGNALPGRYVRIDAKDIIHPFMMYRPEQTRGVPWIIAPGPTLKHLAAYQEAEVVAARVSACKMGMLQRTGDAQYEGETDTAGNKLMDGEPGSFEILPEGLDLKMFDPQHPTANQPGFIKTLLRQISAGLGVSYNNLAEDMESVNFASGKLGLDAERDMWKGVQTWFADHVCNEVFEPWLETQLMFGRLKPYGVLDFDRLNAATWQGRRWPQIDATKETAAIKERIGLRITSVTRTLSEMGIDRDELFQEIQEENELMSAMGIEPVDAFPEEYAPEDTTQNGAPEPDDRGTMPKWFRKLVRSKRRTAKSSLT